METNLGDTIDSAYFLTNAVVSLVVTLATGEMIEAAMVGRAARAGIKGLKAEVQLLERPIKH
jgi:hypothetical protein